MNITTKIIAVILVVFSQLVHSNQICDQMTKIAGATLQAKQAGVSKEFTLDKVDFESKEWANLTNFIINLTYKLPSVTADADKHNQMVDYLLYVNDLCETRMGDRDG